MLNKQLQVYLIEVENTLASNKDEKPSGISNLKKYIGTELDFAGLSVPLQRRVYKAGYSFSHLPADEQLKIWDYIWHNSQLYEGLNQALFFVDKHIDKTKHSILWNVTSTWANRLDNWAHSDGLSGIYAHLLEHNQDLVFPVLQDWNTHEKPWFRRQSLVSLIEYSKKRKVNLSVNQLLPLIEKLLTDEDYFMQKGLGWTLREIYNIYPATALEFMYHHHAAISSVAFTAAIEKLEVSEKENLKALRKSAKQKNYTV